MVDYDAATRAEFDAKFGPCLRDDDAARRAIPLWRSIEAWHRAECTRNPRDAQRHLMSDLSEEAYCASWHYDTEFCLWELITDDRDAWMRLDNTDRATWAVIDGKLFKGEAAIKAAVKLLKHR